MLNSHSSGSDFSGNGSCDARLQKFIAKLRGLPTPELNQLEKLLSDLEAKRLDSKPSGSARPISLEIRNSDSKSLDWPHAPIHRIAEAGTYFVTSGTYGKQHFFRSPASLSALQQELLAKAKQYGWQLEAWACFSNHYHFVAQSEANATKLDVYLTHLHADTARKLNELDQQPGRKVWYNFRDTKLTYQKSYLARLNYVHQNAVQHGLVSVANQYRWCSAAWFERTARPAQVRTIYNLKTDCLRVQDDFNVVIDA